MLVEIFRRAGAPEKVLKRVEEVERRYRAGQITAEEAYYILIGIAFEEAVPLWPRDVGDIRSSLGLPRSREPFSERSGMEDFVKALADRIYGEYKGRRVTLDRFGRPSYAAVYAMVKALVRLALESGLDPAAVDLFALIDPDLTRRENIAAIAKTLRLKHESPHLLTDALEEELNHLRELEARRKAERARRAAKTGARRATDVVLAMLPNPAVTVGECPNAAGRPPHDSVQPTPECVGAMRHIGVHSLLIEWWKSCPTCRGFLPGGYLTPSEWVEDVFDRHGLYPAVYKPWFERLAKLKEEAERRRGERPGGPRWV